MTHAPAVLDFASGRGPLTGRVAVLFPGQGAQTAQMRAEALALRPDLVAVVTDLAGQDPFAGVGTSTRVAQPAMTCATLARWSALAEVLADESIVCVGHSLGELSALVAAGALREHDALALAVERGRAMADAEPGGMVAVLGTDLDEATRLAGPLGLTVANDNAPGQVVLAGPEDRVRTAVRALRADGLRAIRLDVTGAFHSPAMAAPARRFARALATVRFAAPAVPVLSPTTLRPVTDPAAVLAAGLTGRVRFRELVLLLREQGVRRFVDVGPDAVLAHLVLRTLLGSTVTAGADASWVQLDAV